MVWGISSGTVICVVVSKNQLIYVVLPGCLLFVSQSFQQTGDCKIHVFNSSISWGVVRGSLFKNCPNTEVSLVRNFLYLG